MASQNRMEAPQEEGPSSEPFFSHFVNGFQIPMFPLEKLPLSFGIQTDTRRCLHSNLPKMWNYLGPANSRTHFQARGAT
ncbi:hypothetical protein TNIN_841 [Trichonephila inaurata madagascariensis]|uniref:Uncharacterized protein n=1 Tax=Trichonephila inaurata madagascariensis TaxID=2747483 RepID=A0A8X7CNP9_9ARAC|nr:hypothetical protein TNIN_841 [Trichonephila inaurata madagascariensis]